MENIETFLVRPRVADRARSYLQTIQECSDPLERLMHFENLRWCLATDAEAQQYFHNNYFLDTSNLVPFTIPRI